MAFARNFIAPSAMYTLRIVATGVENDDGDKRDPWNMGVTRRWKERTYEHVVVSALYVNEQIYVAS